MAGSDEEVGVLIDAFARLRGDTPLRMAELIDHVRANGLVGKFQLTEFITLDLDAIAQARVTA